MWERDAALGEIISNAWRRAQPVGNLGNMALSLKKVMEELKAWSKENFGNVRRELESLRKELAKLQTDNADRTVIREKMRCMDELLYREEMLWLQRSRISWLQEGDRNTRYFQQKAV